MAVLKLTQMGGISPSVPPRALQQNVGQVAENLQAVTAEFRPTRDDTLVFSGLNVNSPKALYRFDRNADGSLNSSDASGWIGASHRASYVRQQLNDDTTGRIYYVNDDAPDGLKWHDATGSNGVAEVPPPTEKLELSLVDGYVFTSDVRDSEFGAVIATANTAVLSAATPTLVGLGGVIGASTSGWIKGADIGRPETEVLRVFAVNPSDNSIISTYSQMTPAEATWVLDPALGGYYVTTPAGYTKPSWASAHSKWWCLPLRGFARAFSLDQAALMSALVALDMPGTQGEKKLLTDAEATAIVGGLVSAADTSGTVVSDLVLQLEAVQTTVANYTNMGGYVSLREAVEAFYASRDVQDELTSAKNVFAESIWALVNILGNTRAPEFTYSWGS